jgi:hypothetical protein
MDDLLSPILEAAVNQLVSVASRSGYFPGGADSVEPKSAPGNELYFATWIEEIQPIPLRSGLDVTSARVPMICRIYRSMLADPQSRIDIEIYQASSYMLTQLSADFGIEGAYIDLLGAYGDPLGTKGGYIELDRSMFRITDTIVPFIADNVFDQEA